MHHQTLIPLAEEFERDMYLIAIDALTEKGFEHYEISNFCANLDFRVGITKHTGQDEVTSPLGLEHHDTSPG